MQRINEFFALPEPAPKQHENTADSKPVQNNGKSFVEFLESRCFPESRDKMKLILKDLGLPFYDPIMIIEKTAGRMAEDDFWIRIER